MLTGKERVLLKALINDCGEKASHLISEERLLFLLKDKNFTATTLEQSLNSLQVDGYFDFIRCSKDGVKHLCVFPKLKAKCYRREKKQFAESLVLKVILAVLGSVVAFIVTKILYGLF